jgi:hypothetical protein
VILKFSRSRPAATVALGVTLAFTAACNSSGDGAGGPSAAPVATGNTAEICASGGTAARQVVVDLFTKVAEAAKGDTEPTPADLNKIYQQTFSELGRQLTEHAAKATDPELAATLTDIAAEADKVATAPEPAAAGTTGLQAAIGKLEKHCPSGGPSSSAAPAGPGDGTVGAAGSACELPVTFKVADGWKPKAVEVEENDPLAELTRRGPLQMACEIDAKPAGLLGFLRVWIDPSPSAEPRAAVEPFLEGKKNRNVKYTPVTVGGAQAVDVSYEQYQELLEENLKRRAFAVRTPAGVVVLEVGGLSDEDHRSLLPAYELAKGSLAVRP